MVGGSFFSRKLWPSQVRGTGSPIEIVLQSCSTASVFFGGELQLMPQAAKVAAATAAPAADAMHARRRNSAKTLPGK